MLYKFNSTLIVLQENPEYFYMGHLHEEQVLHIQKKKKYILILIHFFPTVLSPNKQPF